MSPLSWDKFYSHSLHTNLPICLSETDQSTQEAAFQELTQRTLSLSSNSTLPIVLDIHQVLQFCLNQLCLTTSSNFLIHDVSTFQPFFRISHCSTIRTKHFLCHINSFASILCRLRQLPVPLYLDPTPNPAHSALLLALRHFSYSLDYTLAKFAVPTNIHFNSLLKFQFRLDVFRPLLLSLISPLLDSFKSTDSELESINRLYHIILPFDLLPSPPIAPPLPLARILLQRCTAPFITNLIRALNPSHFNPHHLPPFVCYNPSTSFLHFSPHNIPSFMNFADAKTIFFALQSLLILHPILPPNHPLLQLSTHFQPLQWYFDWPNIKATFTSASNYFDQLLPLLLQYYQRSSTSHSTYSDIPSPPNSTLLSISLSSQTSVSRDIYKSWLYQPACQSSTNTNVDDEFIEQTDKLFRLTPPSSSVNSDSQIHSLILSYVDPASAAVSNLSFPPLTSSFSLSFSPFIRLQSQLIHTTLLLQLRENSLLDHLILLCDYLLIKHPTFSSILCPTLFRPSSSHPCSTLHVRLLMQASSSVSSLPKLHSLINDLVPFPHSSFPLSHYFSFKLSPPSSSSSPHEKIISPTSPHSLDSLILTYTLRPPLDCIITHDSVSTYEHLFQFLLKIHRANFTVNHLLPLVISSPSVLSSQMYLRCISRHFVHSCLAYFYDDVITANFSLLVQHLDDTLSSPCSPSSYWLESAPTDSVSIYSLSTAHKMTLNRISDGLFLLSHPPHTETLNLFYQLLTCIFSLSAYLQDSQNYTCPPITSPSIRNISFRNLTDNDHATRLTAPISNALLPKDFPDQISHFLQQFKDTMHQFLRSCERLALCQPTLYLDNNLPTPFLTSSKPDPECASRAFQGTSPFTASFYTSSSVCLVERLLTRLKSSGFY